MAIANVYVDPSIASDSGTGTDIDPYGDLAYAFTQKTHPSSGGQQFNIKAGTAESLGGTIDLSTTYAATNAPSESNPLILQGYTSAANDGGIYEIDHNGNRLFNEANLDFVWFVDGKHSDLQGESVFDLDNDIFLVNVEITGKTGTSGSNYVLSNDSRLYMYGCLIHDCAGAAVLANSGLFIGCRFATGPTNDFGTANSLLNFAGSSQFAICYYCEFIVTGAVVCVDTRASNTGGFLGNSFFNESGAAGAKAVDIASTNQVLEFFINNIIEGFTGTGSFGLDGSGSGNGVKVMIGNAFYNNATNYTNSADERVEFNNLSLSASAFVDAANGDLTPQEAGGMGDQDAWPLAIGSGGKDGSVTRTNFKWRGATEPEEPAGGGGSQGISQGLHTISSEIAA